AALGRPGATMAMAMAEDADLERIAVLMDKARRANLVRPPIDLSRVLVNGDQTGWVASGSLQPIQHDTPPPATAGRPPMARAHDQPAHAPPAKPKGASHTDNEDERLDGARIYAENTRVEVVGGVVRVARDSPAHRSRLIFMDVPLLGHASVTAELSA